jgi:membrane protease subunit HflC
MSDKHIENESRSLHWPTIVLGVTIALVFLVVIFSFQLKSTEYAVVSTFGKVSEVKEPGLHFRLPYPFQEIFYFDNRERCFEGSVGKIEETFTADEQNIIVGIYVRYRVVDPVKLFKSEKSVEGVEEKLNSLMRNDKNRVVGKYKFSEFINTDPKKMKITRIENDMKSLLEKTARDKYGVEILSVGIKNLGLHKKVTGEVVKRMKAEREDAAEEFISKGKRIAKNIRTKADAEKAQMIARAEAQAKMIKAEGDAKAAAYYSVFREEPELAVFLKKLEALKKIVRSRTVLVLDTDTAPFNLLKPDAEKLKIKHGK